MWIAHFASLFDQMQHKGFWYWFQDLSASQPLSRSASQPLSLSASQPLSLSASQLDRCEMLGFEIPSSIHFNMVFSSGRQSYFWRLRLVLWFLPFAYGFFGFYLPRLHFVLPRRFFSFLTSDITCRRLILPSGDCGYHARRCFYLLAIDFALRRPFLHSAYVFLCPTRDFYIIAWRRCLAFTFPRRFFFFDQRYYMSAYVCILC